MDNLQLPFPLLPESPLRTLSDLGKKGSPIALLFLDTSGNKTSSSQLLEIVKRAFEKYNGRVLFFWVDFALNGEICKTFAIKTVPLLLILNNNREVARFVCADSEEGIFYNFEKLINQ